MKDKYLDFGLIDFEDIMEDTHEPYKATMDEMAVDTWELKTDLAGKDYYESRATGRRLSVKDFEMWRPSMVPSTKTCATGGAKHVWQVDYVSPFTAQTYESCKVCNIKKEEL